MKVKEYANTLNQLKKTEKTLDELEGLDELEKYAFSKPIVHVVQEIPGTKEGKPKINIIGAAEYGTFKFLLPELSQIIFSPGPLIFKLRQKLKKFSEKDYLLLTGDPAIIGVACSIVSDITNGKYKLLKWDRQERKYYPIEINLYEKGEIDD